MLSAKIVSPFPTGFDKKPPYLFHAGHLLATSAQWAVIAENPQHVTFGADALNADEKGAASYAIFATTPCQSYENPNRATSPNLSRMGSLPVQFGPRLGLPGELLVTEDKDDSARGNGDMLPAVDHKTDGIRLHRGAGLEVPERLARMGVECIEIALG